MLLDYNRSKSRASSSVGNSESLVEVEMAHVCTDLTGRCVHELSVHVGSVHVDLSPILVNNFTNPFDVAFLDSLC